MKYRIRQENDLYYPEYKALFIWWSFQNPYVPGIKPLYFYTLGGAKEFLNRQNKKVVYHDYP